MTDHPASPALDELKCVSAGCSNLARRGGFWCDYHLKVDDARKQDEPTPTRAGREGDSQALPVKNDHEDVQSVVIRDIEKRRELGISRYGTALQPHNGRDMLLDAYEEALDLAIYLKGAIIERDTPHIEIRDGFGRVIDSVADTRAELGEI